MSHLTTKKRLAINALLSGKTQAEAAAAANVTARTLNRWLHDPEFTIELNARESELVAATSRMMAAGARHAVKVMLDTMNSPMVSDSVRLRAASQFLGHLPRVRLLAALDSRLSHNVELWEYLTNANN